MALKIAFVLKLVVTAVLRFGGAPLWRGHLQRCNLICYMVSYKSIKLGSTSRIPVYQFLFPYVKLSDVVPNSMRLSHALKYVY